MKATLIPRFGAIPVSMVIAWALLPGAFAWARPPSGYRAITVAEFEAMPDSLREQGIMVRLKAGAHISLATVDNVESDGPVFAVTPVETNDRPKRGGAEDWDSPAGTAGTGVGAPPPLVSCTPSFRSGGGGSFVAPGPPGTAGRWVSLPSIPQVVHDAAQLLNCDAIEIRGDFVLCRCNQARSPVFDREYFCRNPGYEKLLRRPHPQIHAGYSVIDGAFEVAVPMALIHSFWIRDVRSETAGEFGLDRDNAVRPTAPEQAPAPAQPAHTAFRWPYDMARMDALDEVAARSKLPLDDGAPDVEELADRCSDAYAAEVLSLCLAAEGRSDLALKALQNGIKRTGENPYWAGHRETQDACFVLMLLSVSTGDIDTAVDAAGNVLHMERPDWFFPETLDLFVPNAPHSLLARFLARLETPLRLHWPAFIAALAARLGEASPPRAEAETPKPQRPTMTTAAGDTAGMPLASVGQIEELLSRAGALGLFHRTGIEAEAAARLRDALAAQPDDARLLGLAVEFELSRFGTADRLTRAMNSAEALLRVDATRGHRARAAVREAMGDLAGAEADLVSAAEVDSAATGCGGERGDFYVRNGMYDKAFDVFAGLSGGSSAEQDPDYRFARTAVIARSRVDERIQHMTRHLSRVDAGNKEHVAWTHLRLGRLLALAGRKKEADAEFETAGQLDPLLWQAEAYAKAVKRTGRDDEALR